MGAFRSLRRVLVLAGAALLIVLVTGSVALAAKPPTSGNGNGHGGNGGGGSTPTPTPTQTPGSQVVCVDAGHGGSDPGAVYGGLQEKDLTLQIAGLLGTELASQGYRVIMTRTDDTSLTNTQRAEICNGSNFNGTNPDGLTANIDIAIHLNAASDPTIDYFQAFWGKKNKDLAFSQAITDHYVLPSGSGTGYLTDNAVGQFASGELLKTNCPATLAETVFLSNTEEQHLLGDGTGARQQQIADALDAGIVAWLGPAQ